MLGVKHGLVLSLVTSEFIKAVDFFFSNDDGLSSCGLH